MQLKPELKFCPTLILDIIDTYYFDKLSLEKVAKKFNISYGVVRRIILDSGVEYRQDKKNFTKEEKTQIAKYYRSEISVLKLCDKYNCTARTITKVLVSEGVERRTIKESQEIIWRDQSLREAQRQRTLGSNNLNWKGGSTKLKSKIRNDFKYKNWKIKVFKRDRATCQECGHKRTRKKEVQAHHIMFLSDILQKYKIKNIRDAYKCPILWDIKNGVTLCVDCHHELHMLDRWLKKIL